MLLGLCFPSSCTGEDITKILTYQFNNSSVSGNSQLTVVRVRPVPGSYMLLEDKKFLAFGYVAHPRALNCSPLIRGVNRLRVAKNP